jgi:hypothetical protein
MGVVESLVHQVGMRIFLPDLFPVGKGVPLGHGSESCRCGGCEDEIWVCMGCCFNGNHLEPFQGLEGDIAWYPVYCKDCVRVHKQDGCCRVTYHFAGHCIVMAVYHLAVGEYILYKSAVRIEMEEEGEFARRSLAKAAASATMQKAVSLAEAFCPSTITLELTSWPCQKATHTAVHMGSVCEGLGPIDLQ